MQLAKQEIWRKRERKKEEKRERKRDRERKKFISLEILIKPSLPLLPSFSCLGVKTNVF